MHRFAITHVSRQGLRVLTLPAQKRCMFDTHDEARRAMVVLLSGSTRDQLELCYGPNAFDRFEVRAVPCWDTGDPDPAQWLQDLVKRLAS